MKSILLTALMVALIHSPTVMASIATARATLTVELFDESGGAAPPSLTWIDGISGVTSTASSVNSPVASEISLALPGWDISVAGNAVSSESVAYGVSDNRITTNVSANIGTHPTSLSPYPGVNEARTTAARTARWMLEGGGYARLTVDWALTAFASDLDHESSFSTIFFTAKCDTPRWGSCGGFSAGVNPSYTPNSDSGSFTIYLLSGAGWGQQTGNFSLMADSYASATSLPVPEPESYAFMLAGLGLVGFAARRRRYWSL